MSFYEMLSVFKWLFYFSKIFDFLLKEIFSMESFSLKKQKTKNKVKTEKFPKKIINYENLKEKDDNRFGH